MRFNLGLQQRSASTDVPRQFRLRSLGECLVAAVARIECAVRETTCFLMNIFISIGFNLPLGGGLEP